MSRIWTILLLASVFLSIITGRTGETAAALLNSGEEAVTLLLTLLATMTLWSGLMEILVDTGDVARLGRCFRRVARPLFPGLADDASWEAMGLNLSANLLGLGNAATPAGIQAAKCLAAQGPVGLQALAMLLALDNASLQLMPTTIITLRQAAGALDPGDIWGATLVVSGATTILAALLMRLTHRRHHERNIGHGHRCDGGHHRPAGAHVGE